ncbi:MAG: AAA family ATPase, partial [Moorea sp. SIO3I6]
MVEKLTVKNFAGIKELEIEVKRINIVIGPQASGKSVCAKLLFYFKNFVWKIFDAVENEQTKRYLDSSYSQTFQDYFPPNSWGYHDFYIKYEVYNVGIEISKNKNTKSKSIINFNYSDFFKKELSELRKWLKKIKKESSEQSNQIERRLERLFFTKRILREQLTEFLRSSLCDEAAYTQLFIPAGRSFFANLESTIFSLMSNNNAIDPFLIEFGSTYESIKR